VSDEKIPVLFDTDIGSDIDDAVALTYLLNQPRCELLGVTTVTGKPEVRAQLASAVCHAFGRKEVPIYSGAGRPLLIPQKQPEVPQASVLPKWAHDKGFASNLAVDFLRQTIRSRPGEITLLSVGPLTNIGLLFALDPEIPSLLKQYVMMAGQYFGLASHHYSLTEWNAKGDPHATAIVFQARGVDVRCYGLDVTMQCRMPAEECRRRFSEGPLKLIGEMSEVWFKVRPEITFHDPLAAASVFKPDLCKMVPGRVDIELQSDRLLGLTQFNRHSDDKPHQVAAEVNADAFFEHYFSFVTG
jgi:inosine-uridine nucleoside N-ribohydrolase